MKKLFYFSLLLSVAVSVTVSSCKKELNSLNTIAGNQPPVAIAGPDQLITLPTDSALLDGSPSGDPDGTISSFLWTKILVPAAFNFINSNTKQTRLTSLVEGSYWFELKVTDEAGLSSKDTVKLIVVKAPVETVHVDCNGNIRPQVPAQLIPVSTLSVPREGMAVSAAGDKILFAGGFSGNYSSGFKHYSNVDIIDLTTNSRATAALSQARAGIATAVHENIVYFAGGNLSKSVDIYDASRNQWFRQELSIGRSHIAAAAVGNKVLFAGGIGEGFYSPHWSSAPLDIYNVSSNTWSAGILPGRETGDNIGVAGIATTTIGNKIYFAGNASDWFAWDFGTISSTINIYDAGDNNWSTSELSIPRGFMASIAIGNKNYWAGGLYKQPYDPFSTLVEIRDMNTDVSKFDCLFQPNAFFSAVLKNNKIVFFTSGVNVPMYWSSVNPPVMNKFDIYDITSNSWSIGVLPVDIYGAAVISSNNTIYVAGGYVNGSLSNQVYKLEF